LKLKEVAKNSVSEAILYEYACAGGVAKNSVTSGATQRTTTPVIRVTESFDDEIVDNYDVNTTTTNTDSTADHGKY